MIIDAESLELVASVSFNEYDGMDPKLRATYAEAIPCFYQHAQARNSVAGLNGSMQGVEDAGEMEMFGWRAASDRGKKGGMFVLATCNHYRFLSPRWLTDDVSISL